MQLHLRSDTTIEAFSKEEIILAFPHMKLQWIQPSPALYKRLTRLKTETNQDLYKEEESDLPELFYLLDKLRQHSLLSYTILSSKEPLMTFTPHWNVQWEPKTISFDEDLSIQLSRFAYLHCSAEGKWITESPLMSGTLELKHPKSLEILSALGQTTSLQTLRATFPEISTQTWHSVS